MFHRYYRAFGSSEITSLFQTQETSAIELPESDLAVVPTTMQPVVRQHRDSHERELVSMRWGFVPSFAKSLHQLKASDTCTAHLQNLPTSGTYRTSFERRRCLVPASGFYGWKKVKGSSKQIYKFELPDGAPMAFAGLWDIWKQPKRSPQAIDTWLHSFTVVLVRPDPLLESFNTSMPLMLMRRDYDRWLNRNTTDLAHLILDLGAPFPTAELKMSEVHKDMEQGDREASELIDSAS